MHSELKRGVGPARFKLTNSGRLKYCPSRSSAFRKARKIPEQIDAEGNAPI
jgi:hypothetical protein